MRLLVLSLLWSSQLLAFDHCVALIRERAGLGPVAGYSLEDPRLFAAMLRGRYFDDIDAYRFKPYRDAVRAMRAQVKRLQLHDGDVLVRYLAAAEGKPSMPLRYFWDMFFRVSHRSTNPGESWERDVDHIRRLHHRGTVLYPIVEDEPIVPGRTIRYRPLGLHPVQLVLTTQTVHGCDFPPPKFAQHDVNHAELLADADGGRPATQRADDWARYDSLWHQLYDEAQRAGTEDAGILFHELIHEPLMPPAAQLLKGLRWHVTAIAHLIGHPQGEPFRRPYLAQAFPGEPARAENARARLFTLFFGAYRP